jgi:hypothetical protein
MLTEGTDLIPPPSAAGNPTASSKSVSIEKLLRTRLRTFSYLAMQAKILYESYHLEDATLSFQVTWATPPCQLTKAWPRLNPFSSVDFPRAGAKHFDFRSADEFHLCISPSRLKRFKRLLISRFGRLGRQFYPAGLPRHDHRHFRSPRSIL